MTPRGLPKSSPKPPRTGGPLPVSLQTSLYSRAKLQVQLPSAKAAFRHSSEIVLIEKSKKNEAQGTAEILRLLAGLFPSPPKPPSIPQLKLYVQLQSAKAALRHPPQNLPALVRAFPLSPKPPFIPALRFHTTPIG